MSGPDKVWMLEQRFAQPRVAREEISQHFKKAGRPILLVPLLLAGFAIERHNRFGDFRKGIGGQRHGQSRKNRQVMEVGRG